MADTAVARLRGILAATMTRTTIDQLLGDVFTEQLRGCTVKGTAVVPRPAPPHAGHLALCGQTAHRRDGTVVTCAKAAAHASPWHRQDAHHWRTVFGTPGKLPQGGHTGHELGQLRVTARDLGDVLRQIVATSAGGCACGDLAAAALVDLGREVTADA